MQGGRGLVTPWKQSLLIKIKYNAIQVISSLIIVGVVRCFFFNYCWCSVLFLL